MTFSKRRAGLFKKASEISTLCGAEVAMIVFSPSDKAFSFGNPSVESVLDRFLNGNEAPPEMMMMQLMQEEHSNAVVRDQNLHLDHILSLLEVEKRRSGELNRAIMEGTQEWWRGPTEELTLDQLHHLKVLLLGLKRNIESQAERVVVQMSTQPPQPPLVQCFGVPSLSQYGVDRSRGFDNFADPESNGQIIPHPYNLGYDQHQGFY